MAKTNAKKPAPVQKGKGAKNVAAPKPSKALAVNKAKALPKKAVAPAKPAPAKRPDVKTAKAAPVAVAKKPAAKTTAAPKAVVAPPKKNPVPAKAAPAPVKAAPPAPAKPASRRIRFNKTDLKFFQLELLAMRDRITNQSGSMKSAALQRTDEVNPEEDGTDAFMRLQTLEQVGTQQGVVTKIDEALHAISKGTYGACDICGELISKERLTVLPFARNCIRCQSEMERLNRYGRYR